MMPIAPILPSPIRVGGGDDRLRSYYAQQKLMGQNPQQARNLALYMAQGGVPGAGQQAPNIGQTMTLTPWSGTQPTGNYRQGPGGGNATGMGSNGMESWRRGTLPTMDPKGGNMLLNDLGQLQGGMLGGTNQNMLPDLPGLRTQIQTSIQPKPMYAPWMTNLAASIATGEQFRRGDMRSAMKKFDRPGISRGAGQAYMAMPQVAQGYAAGRTARAGIPMQDYFANQSNLLRGQIAREQEGLGLGNLSARLLGGQLDAQSALQDLQFSRLGMFNPLLDLLGG